MNKTKRAERNEAIRSGVDNLVTIELDYAMGEHGLYHSPHEAWAVMLEELEETKDEMEAARNDFARLYTPIFKARNPHKMRDIAAVIAQDARNIMTEAAHLASAAEKLIKSIESAPNSYFKEERKSNDHHEEN